MKNERSKRTPLRRLARSMRKVARYVAGLASPIAYGIFCLMVTNPENWPELVAAAGRRKVTVMTPNYEKLVDVVLVLLHKAAKMGYEVTQFDLAKAVFIADRRRLNECDRPITYDIYEAMTHGPVPLTLFKLLKQNREVIAKTGPVAWERRQVSEGSKKYHYYGPKRRADLGLFAPNDLKALEEALVFVKEAGVTKVRRETHLDPSFRMGRYNKKAIGQSTMEYALLRKVPDEALARRLSERSREFASH